MFKFNKVIALFLMLLIAAFGVVGVANADRLIGTGWIDAEGNGAARIRAAEITTLEVTGSGSIWFYDGGETDEPVVSGFGRKVEYANGWVKYTGSNGSFSLENADSIIVRFYGRDLNLYAEGTGSVWLRGNGTYSYGNEDGTAAEGSWSVRGDTIVLDE